MKYPVNLMKKTLSANQDQIKKLEDKISELSNNWKRALADYQNLVRRTDEEKQKWNEYASKKIIVKLLPILDTLETAASHLNDDGLNMVTKQFQEILQQEGVTKIKAVEAVFDPKLHECVDTAKGEKNGIISKVYTSGYLYKDTILRPAKVQVMKTSQN